MPTNGICSNGLRLVAWHVVCEMLDSYVSYGPTFHSQPYVHTRCGFRPHARDVCAAASLLCEIVSYCVCSVFVCLTVRWQWQDTNWLYRRKCILAEKLASPKLATGFLCTTSNLHNNQRTSDRVLVLILYRNGRCLSPA